MRYIITETNQYKKALKKYKKSGDFDVKKLNKVINLLVENSKIPPKYKDHKLSGDMNSFRELHVQPDLLLVYKKEKKLLVLLLVNLGSHSNLF